MLNHVQVCEHGIATISYAAANLGLGSFIPVTDDGAGNRVAIAADTISGGGWHLLRQRRDDGGRHRVAWDRIALDLNVETAYSMAQAEADDVFLQEPGQ